MYFTIRMTPLDLERVILQLVYEVQCATKTCKSPKFWCKILDQIERDRDRNSNSNSSTEIH
jgi:hypothetical protein